MKKIYFLFSFLFVSLLTFSQQVPRENVLVEIGTGTWCTYCPGAAIGADELILNGHSAAVIEHHASGSDPFITDDSQARVDYYSIGSFPTAKFDGSYDEYVGGSHTASMYNNYYPKVDARILEDSDFTLELFGINDGDDYTVSARLQEVGDYSGTNLSLRFTLTESEIEYTWQDQDILNFVNRLMVPDHNGIDLSSYDLSEENTIYFEFTFDNTWNDQHCEIVVFIQDDDNQEVLQSQKVELLDLEPMLSANFTASATISCAGSSIDFTDASDGESISTWSWYFEGGNPSTSTDQNPTVTYPGTGVFDVELTITDPYGTSTTMQSDYISILETPGLAGTPEGDDEVCTGMNYTYTIPVVEFTQVYEWELSPENAGELIIDENQALLETADDWTGDFTLRVRATNICGDGEWSDALSVTLYQSPEEYALQGGGGFCVDGDGVELTLNGSDTGIEYELYLDGEATGNIVSGTGSGISFGLVTEAGYYNALAYTDNCSKQMMEQIEVFHLFPPLEPGIPEGPEVICNNEISEYASSGSDDAESYAWIIEPEGAGTITANGLDASIEWNAEFSGTAGISLYGVNECGDGVPCEALQVSVDAIPVPAVEGQELVCDFDVNEYTTPENEGCTYHWEVAGGTIVEGQGTYMVTVEWGEAGQGTLNVEEETPNGCLGTAEQFDVTIDECTSLSETNDLSIHNIYPNPASNTLYVELSTLSSDQVQLTVQNQLGQVLFFKKLETSGNSTKHVIDISTLPKGMYIIQLNDNKSTVTRQFIKE